MSSEYVSASWQGPVRIRLTSSDIVECTRVSIQEWVQESERAFSGGEKLIVNQRNNTGENGA